LKQPILFTIYSNNSISIRRFLMVVEKLRQMGRPTAFLDYHGGLRDTIARHASRLGLDSLPQYLCFEQCHPADPAKNDFSADITIRFPAPNPFQEPAHDRQTLPPEIRLLRLAGIDIAPLLNRMVNDNLRSFISEAQSAERILRMISPACLVYDIEIPKRTRALLHAARCLAIPSVSMQHGEGNCEQYDQLPILSDFYVAYSPYNFRKLKEMGVLQERIFLTGAPETDLLETYDPNSIRSELCRRFRITPDKEMILVALKPNNSKGFYQFNQQLLSILKTSLDGASNHQIVVKQHPTDLQQSEIDYLSDFQSRFPRMIHIPGDFVISKLFAVSGYFITFLSSALVEAIIQDNYTIVIEKDNLVRWPDWNWFGVYDSVNLEALPQTLSKIVSGRYASEMQRLKLNRKEFSYFYRFKMDRHNSDRVAAALERTVTAFC